MVNVKLPLTAVLTILKSLRASTAIANIPPDMSVILAAAILPYAL